MIKILKKPRQILIGIILLTAFLHLFRLDYPNAYVFDEVYHGFTAKEYLAGHKEAWEWWTTPPPGVAYEWTHPPLGKEIMTASMFLVRSTDAWAWRLPGALLGILSVCLIYLLAKTIFKKEEVGLLSAFIFSLDGLNFVQSRTGMIDVYFVCSMLACLLLISRNKFFFASIALGLALASKWTGLYLFGMVIILLLYKKALHQIPYFIFVPASIYLLSYIPFFIAGHDHNLFIELQKQMWWYHTNLKATHDYASPWWSWPLNLYPVWYYVEYSGDKIGNIFASGNPVMFWTGAIAVLLTTWEFIKSFGIKIKDGLLIKLPENMPGHFFILLGYFIFWLPWALSPRIMFLYHYSPSLPFLAMALGYQLSLLLPNKDNHKLLFWILAAIALGFIFVYPFITGILLPKNLMELFFMTNLTKNPF